MRTPSLLHRRSLLAGLAAIALVPALARAAEVDDGRVDRKVAEIFGLHLGVAPESLKPSDRFLEDMLIDDIDDLGDILTDIERQFGIDIPVVIATQFTTMGNVIQFIKDLLASQRF